MIFALEQKEAKKVFVLVLSIHPQIWYLNPADILVCLVLRVPYSSTLPSDCLIFVLIRPSAETLQTSLCGICEKVPLNQFYLLCYLKTICPHSPCPPLALSSQTQRVEVQDTDC